MAHSKRHALKFSTVAIGPGGAMPNAPTVMSAQTGEWVVWVVRNRSAKRLTLTLKDFTRRSTGKPVKAVRWLKSSHAAVPAGGTAIIAGQVTYRPSGPRERVKYTVGVKGPGTRDYDPDLEIIRPN